MNEFGINSLVEGMLRYVGQTVTIFTTSGGLSGSGFTGVLVFADNCTVRLLVEMGWPPSCALGSACTGPIGDSYGCGGGYGGGYGYANVNPLGAICEIPTHAIACFTHNAI